MSDFIVTDMQGLAPARTMMDSYTGMREIVNLMLGSNMPKTTVRKLAGENYGRLLKTVLQGRAV